MIILNCEQGTDEWFNARLGVITMSNAKALITMNRKGDQYGATRTSYLNNVAAEILSGKASENISTWQMERGSLLEKYALKAYQAETGIDIETIGFGYLNNEMRIGASPDGLSKSGGLEIKCPSPKKHLSTLQNGFPKEHNAQIQGNMWIFERESWDFVSYCPEFKSYPLYIKTIERDEQVIDKIKTSSESGVLQIYGIISRLCNRKYNNRKEIESIGNDAINAVADFFNNEEIEIEL